jgi:predicted PurR-regulated permease PerM
MIKVFRPAAIAFANASHFIMATHRILPPDEREAQLQAESGPQLVSPRAPIHKSTAAQITVAAAVLLVICYLAKLVLVTLMVSILLAFVLEPLVGLLERIRLPRSVGAFVAVLVLLGAIYGASYFFYNRAVSFAEELPKYSQKIRGMVSRVTQQTNRLQQVTEKVLPQNSNNRQKPVPVTIEGNNKEGIIRRNLGTLTEIALTAAFIPFLVYFMLSWQEHARTQTVQLFPVESRTTAYVTMGQISLMMRSFITGNFIVGVFLGLCSLAVFGFLKLPYFYFLGFISGFLSLVPYLGVILALVPPLTAGLGSLNTTKVLIIFITVLGLHIFAMNVLYPKVIGKRLQLNPLIVTIGLLVWGFIWGAMGLILAVPILGAIKIICDHVPNLRAIGAWMGE